MNSKVLVFLTGLALLSVCVGQAPDVYDGCKINGVTCEENDDCCSELCRPCNSATPRCLTCIPPGIKCHANWNCCSEICDLYAASQGYCK